ncbi:hypothetical protein MTO96_044591 [Rhipicephalus appendiculatus]
MPRLIIRRKPEVNNLERASDYRQRQQASATTTADPKVDDESPFATEQRWDLGTGLGTTILGLCVYQLLYFDKYRGTAAAITWIFRATSGMAGMPLLWYLTGNYGAQGCLLMMGGLVMHCVPIIMLIKSPRPCRLFIRNKTCRSKVYTTGKESFESPDIEISEAVSSSDQQLHQCPTLKDTATTSWLRTALASFTTLPFYVLVVQSVVSEYVFVSFNVTIVAYAVDKGLELHQGQPGSYVQRGRDS